MTVETGQTYFRHLRNMMAMAISVVTLFACKQRLETSETSGVYVKHTLWGSKSIPVCWNNQSDVEVDGISAMKIVETVVTREYARAGFDLTGWNTCPTDADNSKFIRIEISDEQPWGYYGCKRNGRWCVRLNFNFVAWPRPDGKPCPLANIDRAWACNCQISNKLRTCIETYALHEIAHALGLAHEADHKDNISSCKDRGTRDTNAEDVGAYDPDSITNYCANKRDIVKGSLPTLSDGDIETLHTIYKER